MNFVNEIEDKIQVRLIKMNIPIPVYLEFKDYCKQECGDNFAVGIFQLMKTKKSYEDLIPLLSQLLNEVNQLKDQINNRQNERRLKTFNE